ncbi:unnamed protein product [Prunus armeniaca]|nr:hypothetical protein GBA52_016387 [Prunus armeniaca]
MTISNSCCRRPGHSPFTTLKLIFNLRHRCGKFDEQAFYTAAYWLYQYHHKTLACNVIAIAASFGTIPTFSRDQLPNARFYHPITQGIEGRT